MQHTRRLRPHLVAAGVRPARGPGVCEQTSGHRWRYLPREHDPPCREMTRLLPFPWKRFGSAASDERAVKPGWSSVTPRAGVR